MFLRISIAAIFLLSCNSSPDKKINKERVVSLINDLASPTPPELDSGVWDQAKFDMATKKYKNYMTMGDVVNKKGARRFQSEIEHLQVTEATKNLISMGTSIYPLLVEYLDDRRFSYSLIIQAWANHSVGDKVKSIMAHGIEIEVKDACKKIPDRFDINFEKYLSEQNIEEWAKRASNSNKKKLRADYIKWYCNTTRNTTACWPYLPLEECISKGRKAASERINGY